MITIEQLKQSSKFLIKARPAYRPMLEFYTQVFLAQEKSCMDILLPPVEIEADLLKIKQINKMPLIDQSEFLYDLKISTDLFFTICDLACNLAPKLSASAQLFKTAAKTRSLDLKILFTGILNNQTSTLHDLARIMDVPEQDLIFMGYASIAPGIQICARQLKTYLKTMPDFKKGYCPICGNPPDMAFLDKKGKRHLKCCFCSHEWMVNRMGCVFCDSNDKNLQHYLFFNEEKEYRVNLCDNCHHYIKMVDLRNMNRSFYPKLEQITTLHLDMKAREKGYTNSGITADDIFIS